MAESLSTIFDSARLVRSIAAVVHWAVVFAVGMLAVPPPHHTWAWLALAPMCWHYWRLLMSINALIRARRFA